MKRSYDEAMMMMKTEEEEAEENNNIKKIQRAWRGRNKEAIMFGLIQKMFTCYQETHTQNERMMGEDPSTLFSRMYKDMAQHPKKIQIFNIFANYLLHRVVSYNTKVLMMKEENSPKVVRCMKNGRALLLMKTFVEYPKALLWGGKYYNNHRGDAENQMGGWGESKLKILNVAQRLYKCFGAAYNHSTLIINVRRQDDEQQREEQHNMNMMMYKKMGSFLLTEFSRLYMEYAKAFVIWREVGLAQKTIMFRHMLIGYEQVERFHDMWSTVNSNAHIQEIFCMPHDPIRFHTDHVLRKKEKDAIRENLSQNNTCPRTLLLLDHETQIMNKFYSERKTEVKSCNAFLTTMMMPQPTTNEEEKNIHHVICPVQVICKLKLDYELMIHRAKQGLILHQPTTNMINEVTGRGNIGNSSYIFVPCDWPDNMCSYLKQSIEDRLIITTPEQEEKQPRDQQTQQARKKNNSDILLRFLQDIKNAGMLISANSNEVERWNKTIDCIYLKEALLLEELDGRFEFTRQGNIEILLNSIFEVIKTLVNNHDTTSQQLDVAWTNVILSGYTSSSDMETLNKAKANAILVRLEFLFGLTGKIQSRLYNHRMTCSALSMIIPPSIFHALPTQFEKLENMKFTKMLFQKSREFYDCTDDKKKGLFLVQTFLWYIFASREQNYEIEYISYQNKSKFSETYEKENARLEPFKILRSSHSPETFAILDAVRIQDIRVHLMEMVFMVAYLANTNLAMEENPPVDKKMNVWRSLPPSQQQDPVKTEKKEEEDNNKIEAFEKLLFAHVIETQFSPVQQQQTNKKKKKASIFTFLNKLLAATSAEILKKTNHMQTQPPTTIISALLARKKAMVTRLTEYIHTFTLEMTGWIKVNCQLFAKEVYIPLLLLPPGSA